MQNLRDRLYDIYDELCCRISFFFHRLRCTRRCPKTKRAVLRGTAHNMISVTPPDTEMFREALFILQDDYMRLSGDSEALLREAKEAAEHFTAKFSPPETEPLPRLVFILPILTAALGFFLGRIV